MKEPNLNQQVIIELLAEGLSLRQVAAKLECSHVTIYKVAKKYKDLVIERARDHLTLDAIRAVHTVSELLDADASTEKGELRLAAAEKIMDRVGLTKHSSIEVKTEADSGIFIIPAKIPAPKETEVTNDTNTTTDTEDSSDD